VHVTIKLAPPYDRYGLGDREGPVLEGTGMAVFDELAFDAALFPGYAHQTTLSDAKASFTAKTAKVRCRTYVYVPLPGSQSGPSAAAGQAPTETGGHAAASAVAAAKAAPFSFASVAAKGAAAAAAAAAGSEDDDDEAGMGGSSGEGGDEGSDLAAAKAADVLSKNQKRRRAKKDHKRSAKAAAAESIPGGSKALGAKGGARPI
jgi:hypothetical protein